MRIRSWARLALAALCALVAPAHAQTAGRVPGSENGFTVYGGFRGGGDLTEATTEEKLHVDTTPSFALAVDIAYEPRKQLQVFYSHQKGDLSSAAGALAPVQVPLTIEYLHIGGTAFLEGMGDGGYASAGIGATRLTPNSPGLAAETKPSLSIAFGYMLPLVPGLGLRFEARGYATWIDSNGSLFCRTSSGCPVSIKGNGFYQGDALIGLTARF
jgi:hypothetical protein